MTHCTIFTFVNLLILIAEPFSALGIFNHNEQQRFMYSSKDNKLILKLSPLQLSRPQSRQPTFDWFCSCITTTRSSIPFYYLPIRPEEGRSQLFSSIAFHSKSHLNFTSCLTHIRKTFSSRHFITQSQIRVGIYVLFFKISASFIVAMPVANWSSYIIISWHFFGKYFFIFNTLVS